MSRKQKKRRVVSLGNRKNSISSKQPNEKPITKIGNWIFSIFGLILVAVVAWFMTAPNVFSLGKEHRPNEVFARSDRPDRVSIRGGMTVQLFNFSLRPATIMAEIIPKGVVIFSETEKTKIEKIERIPDAFELSRQILDVSNGKLPQIGSRKVRAEFLLSLKFVGKRVVYVYKLRWIADNQGEVDSVCLRFPAWSQNSLPVSDKDSRELTCD